MNKTEDKYDLNTKKGRVLAWLEALIIDHNLINYLYKNFYKISDNAYRSAQPTMGQLEKVVKKYGIKTVLNLKGAHRDRGYYLLEERKCKELGVSFVSAEIYSRDFPDYNRIKRIKETFETIEYPVLIHCKAGADRAGIVSTLYQYFVEKRPMEATDQLKFWPYGHVKYSKAGKSDLFFEEFMQYNKENPDNKMGLLEWTKEVMDREDMEKRFTIHPWADFLYDYILRRE